MIHNKHSYDNRHSRGAWLLLLQRFYNHGLPRAGTGGNPAIQKCFGFTHWIPACAGMTKIFIAVCGASLALTNSAQAGTLGRLFFTPQQRAQLEHDRTMKTTPTAAPPSVLSVNGIVQRKGGARTVWINGVPQNAGSSDERTPESLPVSVPGQSKPVKLKVGQQIVLDKSAPKDPSATDK